jgi:hypothetical protein
MSRFRLAILVLGMALFSAPAFAQGNLVVNGSFEDPVYGAAVSYPVPVTGWTIAPDSGFEVWNNFQGPGADGSQYLELDVFTCNTVSQTIPTSSGSDYLISFAFGARNGVADNRVQVSWNGQPVGTASADGTGQAEIVWTSHSFLVRGAPGSSTLEFTNIDACDGVGSMLDNVSVLAQEIRVVPALAPAGTGVLIALLALSAAVVLRRLRPA